jgi:hypothetical protein
MFDEEETLLQVYDNDREAMDMMKTLFFLHPVCHYAVFSSAADQEAYEFHLWNFIESCLNISRSGFAQKCLELHYCFLNASSGNGGMKFGEFYEILRSMNWEYEIDQLISEAVNRKFLTLVHGYGITKHKLCYDDVINLNLSFSSFTRREFIDTNLYDDGVTFGEIEYVPVEMSKKKSKKKRPH